MNIPKAIEILKKHDHLNPEWGYPELYEAIKLSIEALKLKQRLNSWSHHWHENLLPGETED